MTLEFESPERLEERIAANMADESDDLSLGINRRGTSFASISISNEDISLSGSGGLSRMSIPMPPPRASISASSTPHVSKIDQERMKAYVLNSVKRTNPLRELRNMSSPRRRPSGHSSFNNPGSSKLRIVEDISISRSSQENDSESFISDVSSTRDLTLPAKMAARANASFSGVGVNEGATPASAARVDPIRLQGYLHKINVQLESENVTLKEEKEALKRQFNRALMDCERLRMQLETKGDTSAQSNGSSGERGREVEELKKEIDALRIGQDELNDMLDEREAELDAAEQKLKQAQSQDDLLERYRELEDELTEEKDERGRLEEQIQQTSQAQRDFQAKITAERDAALAEVDRLKQSNASISGTSDHEKETSFVSGEREARLEAALESAQADRVELEKRLEEDAAICEDLEAELLQVKEDLMQCEEELNTAKDQIVDLQIAAEEKESENIKLTMQLRQAKESNEMQQLREKVVLLEAQLEGIKNESIRQSTPLHRNVSLLRKPIDTPRSPAELSNASWLNNESTLGDKSVLRNLAELRVKVDQAHAETDEKVAQLGTAQLAQRLVEVQNELDLKEEEIKQMTEREHRFRKRLERIQCQQCRSRLAKIDLDQSVASVSMTTNTEGDTSLLGKSTRSSHQKEQIVAEIAEQLNELKTKWAIDRAKLDEEKGALDIEKQTWTKEKVQLQTENRRLKTERENRMREAKDHVKKMQDGTLRDLSRARRIIGEFERELKHDCSRFQEAVQNSRGLDQDAEEVDRELQRTKRKLIQVEEELKQKMDTFEKLQSDLFEKSQMDKSLPLHVQVLEREVQKFSIEVENARNERNTILEERQKLYSRHQRNQQEYMNMHEELRGAREAITAHQIQLDEQIDTIEKLHQTLTSQNKDLEVIHHDRDRLQVQRKEILSDVACLEGDLRRVREESKRFGSDLEKLRAEQEHTRKQEAKMEKIGISREEHKNIQKKMIMMQQREAASQSRHHAECQGLLLQIRYEKAKFMRESDLRSDLIQQKKYAVELLAGMELVDATTSQFLAAYSRRKGTRGGEKAQPKVNRFKVVAHAVLAICRARLMAQHWQQTLSVKKALREAHKASRLVKDV